MTENIINTNQRLLVAIDIAKSKHNVLIEYPNNTRKSMIIKNILSDFKRLEETLKKVNVETIVGFEATADYHRPIAYYLQNAGFQCCLISSVATARTRDAMYNSWDKNDPKDAQVILHLIKTGVVQIYHDPLINKYNDIQELSNTYHQTSKRKTRIQHSLINHYLALYFPEAEHFFCSSRAKWFMTFLSYFPCPKAITKHKKERFIKLACKIPGRKVNKLGWLNNIYEAASVSVGLPITEDSQAAYMLKNTLAEYLLLCENRERIEASVKNKLEDNMDFHRLQTIVGIGPIIALTILAEAGDLRRFGHQRQFIKFCGFDLCTYQSGTLRGKTHLSKRGNSRLRQVLWMAAQVAAIKQENSFRRKFKKYVEKDPTNSNLKRKAYTAIAVKMARVVYAVIKKQTDYQGCYNLDNPIEQCILTGP